MRVRRAVRAAATESSGAVLAVVLLLGISTCTAQSTSSGSAGKSGATSDGLQLQPGVDPDNRLGKPFVKHLVQDQKEFWLLPTRIQTQDLKWIVPSAGVLAGFIASDSWWSKQIPLSHVQTSLHFSDYATYAFAGAGGAAYLLGQIKHDDHLSETGLLSGEAAINSIGVAYLLKEATQRERPFQDSGNGDFFTGGSSFPSQHSAIAWSIASVVAHEYPGWFTQAAAYSLATAVAATRVTAQQHFPSDVLVGSALGWYFGRQVYRAHHDPELGGSGWGSIFEEKSESTRNPAYMASPDVPLDSWIYPALERLIAMGYVQSAMLGMRPWTRMECARLLDDAADKIADLGDDNPTATKTYSVLTKEFATEEARLNGASNVGARLDSVYTRATEISGTPVRDGYHFGQTIVNDYGRPYWTGFNNVTGAIADAEIGPVAFSFQGEYQRAPPIPSESSQALAATAAADFDVGLPNGQGETNRFQLLNSTVSWTLNNVQFSFGEQSQWLGPGEGGALLLSDNAPPFPTFRIANVAPYTIQGLSRLLGDIRTEFFIGQLSGQHWEFCAAPSCAAFVNYQGVVGPNISVQPFIQGQKISFKPTENLEIGMGFTAMFGGPGLPVTWKNFLRTYYVHSSVALTDPGKRSSAADFTYRVPGLRNWLTIYADSLVVDEVSPIGSTRATVNPGVYLPHLPKLPKLELRAEGFNEPTTREFPPGFVYYDFRRYRSGYTNDGMLLGSWIGRAGRGAESWLTYWISPRNKLQFNYRLQEVSPAFIEGGRLVDYSGHGDFMLGPKVGVSALMQYEQWWFPVLSSTRQSDVTASVQINFYPHLEVHK